MAQVSLTNLISYLNPATKSALEGAAGDAMQSGSGSIEVEHWFKSLLQGSDMELIRFLEQQKVDTHGLLAEIEGKLKRSGSGAKGQPTLSGNVVDLIQSSWLVCSIEFGHRSISGLHVLYALLQADEFGIRRNALDSLDEVSFEALKGVLEQQEDRREAGAGASSAGGPVSGGNGALAKYATNLTQQALDGELDPISGRGDEVRQAIDILCRKRQNNPIFVGEPGVGKTAVVEGLAQKIAAKEVPEIIQNVQIHSLDLGLLQAGASVKGEFESRLKDVINEVKNSETPIICFIDEAHTLIGAGGAEGQNDAANLLKPALARGEFRTIGATTWEEYKKYFEKDPALTRRFQVVEIAEPSAVDALHMLRGIGESLKAHHGVTINEAALTAAVALSTRFLPSRKLPDKAISILDTACARIALTQSAKPMQVENLEQKILYLQNEITALSEENALFDNHNEELSEKELQEVGLRQELTELTGKWEAEKALVNDILLAQNLIQSGGGDKQIFRKLLEDLKELQGDSPMVHAMVDGQVVAEVIGSWTGIPVGNMLADEVTKLLNLEETLRKRIIGQTLAIEELATTIRVSRAGLTDSRKPVGVFLMCGPSGVGKSETALALAEQLYGGEKDLTVINMTEFKEEHKVSMLLGAPAGYVGFGKGGVLTEAIRRNPYCVLLLDEMEKAHPGVHDVFYQIFDKGTVQDSEGRTIDFRNTLIIMTSNAADSAIVDACHTESGRPEASELVETIRPALQEYFKPAFLGRTNVIPYYPLNQEELRKICQLAMKRIELKLQETYSATLVYSDDFLDFVVKKGDEPTIGGRAIEQVINRSLMPMLAERCIENVGLGESFETVEIKMLEGGGGYELAIS